MKNSTKQTIWRLDLRWIKVLVISVWKIVILRIKINRKIKERINILANTWHWNWTHLWEWMSQWHWDNIIDRFITFVDTIYFSATLSFIRMFKPAYHEEVYCSEAFDFFGFFFSFTVYFMFIPVHSIVWPIILWNFMTSFNRVHCTVCFWRVPVDFWNFVNAMLTVMICYKSSSMHISFGALCSVRSDGIFGAVHVATKPNRIFKRTVYRINDSELVRMPLFSRMKKMNQTIVKSIPVRSCAFWPLTVHKYQIYTNGHDI